MKTSGRADQLQFLRFCAFLLICIFHTGKFQFSWLPNGNGAANAVAFFIVLSGFVSGYSSYLVDVECNLRQIIYYIWKKLKKVYPLYFVTMLFTIGYSNIPNLVAMHSFGQLKVSLIQLLKCLLLIQSWYPSGYFKFNGVGWFLSTIIFLYLFNLPLRALFTKLRKRSDLYFGLIFIVEFAIIVFQCYLTRNTNMEYTQYILPPSRIGEYICGMALGYLSFQ